MELTFVAIKPDGVERGLVAEIAGRFEKRGFKIVGLKLVKPSKQLAERHYEEHKGKPFFADLVSFLSSGPVLAMALEGDGVIAASRTMIGATDPKKSAPGTIRGDLCVEMSRNVVHGSDSPASAKREIALWFNKDELVQWQPTMNKWLYGDVEEKAAPIKLPPVGDKFYITTAINYTNGNPHMGHAYEAITSDVLARYHRMYGREVFFLTGTDEHGQKIAETAEGLNKTPQQICDQYANAFQELNKKLNISNDGYIRTTMDKHKKTAQLLWDKAFKAGDIYLGKYEGWYNVKEETFVTETEAAETDYKCPVTGRPLEKKNEESYFFRASKYQGRLLEHIRMNPEFIQPESRLNEIKAFLSEDLHDLCISRNTFSWGVPVPKDDLGSSGNHVMYVWFDALTNYLSGVGFPDGDNSKFWPASVHIIGKDIIRFHTITWPCMLMSAQVPLPRCVFAHGFVHASDGQKMSKSLGNVIDPHTILANHTTDTFRYFLVTEGSFGGDLSFSEESMAVKHNAVLADTLGNLVQRGLAMCHQSPCDGRVPDAPADMVFDVAGLKEKSEKAYHNFSIHLACELAVSCLRDANKYLTDKEPWKIKGEDQESKTKKLRILRSVLESIYVLNHFLQPILPESCDTIFQWLNTPPTSIKKLSNNFDNLKVGTAVIKPAAKVGLFPKIEKSKTVQTAKTAAPTDSRLPFQRAVLRVGEVLSVADHPTDQDRLFVTQVSIGEEETRQVVAGLKAAYSAEQLTGQKVVVVCNLPKADLKGVSSEGMMLVSDEKGAGQKLLDPGAAAVGTPVQLADKPCDSQGETITKKEFDKIKFKIKGGAIVVNEGALMAGEVQVKAHAADGSKVK